MLSVELVFNCEHCGEPLGTERKNSLIKHNELHDCFGEKLGTIAMIQKQSIVIVDGVEMEIKKTRER